EFGVKPNQNTCPICLGLPGTLPVLNEEVVNLAVKAGLALNCEINKLSKMDRKNYFYPDLPKAYQTSKYDLLICRGGYVEIDVDGVKKKIRLNRIHIEEDAGKLVHIEHEPYSLVDYNRTGVPLIEIVTEPDLRSPQ
ncbi:MAG: Asp-tRNA(Asn)/Glu-tRNA(Gln) amidotransferase GatCAB subunit B, partial [Spirochaetes bacterium]|nr:Asp-tRNA(Asn)/Glu-tRNA(Gln) amidotransferase GatCAB subunit B [Spirochaetota bacterium]